MARKVKCHITKEEGTTDTFVKIGSHYYKSQEVYEEDRRQKETRKELVDYICRTFLGYKEGQPFPTMLTKKLSELSFYSNEVILETFKTCEKDLLYYMGNKDFSGDYGRIQYIFAVIGNKVADVNRTYKKKIAEVNKKNSVIDAYDFDNPNLSGKSGAKTNSLLGFLEGDEI